MRGYMEFSAAKGEEEFLLVWTTLLLRKTLKTLNCLLSDKLRNRSEMSQFINKVIWNLITLSRDNFPEHLISEEGAQERRYLLDSLQIDREGEGFIFNSLEKGIRLVSQYLPEVGAPHSGKEGAQDCPAYQDRVLEKVLSLK